MPTTPNLGLPYPTLSLPADVPSDIEALAVKLGDVVDAGRLLAVKYFVPAGDQSYAAPPNTWVCLGAIDPNLNIGPVVAPASGRVLAEMRGGYIAANGTGIHVLGAASPGPGVVPAASVAQGIVVSGSAPPYGFELLLGGLTPGDEYTFVPWLYVQDTNGNLYLSNSGLAGGGFLMQVHSA